MTTNAPTPDDAARETAARAAFDAFYADGTPYTEIERAMFLQVADAVLAAKGISLAGPEQVAVDRDDVSYCQALLDYEPFPGWKQKSQEVKSRLNAALSATRTAQDHDGGEER